MGEQAAEAIRAAIRDHGPISFAEFMELALYGPGGFYERPPIGPEGDFVTSPHVHPVFGHLLASGLREIWDQLGRPRPFRVTELGAGNGTLARQLLDALADVPLRYAAVERSPGAREALRSIGGLDVSEEIPGEAHVFLANEFLDNHPFHRVRRTGGGLVEVRVLWDGERFQEVETPRTHAELAELVPPMREGEEWPVSPAALRFVDQVAERLHGGYALLIDYGEDEGVPGQVHGYRGHRLVADVLAEPGAADITAGVDFGALVRRAEEHGLVAFGPVTQREALTALGFDRWTRDELSRQGELLNRSRGLEAVRVWGGRSRASLLIEPTGLGRLRWLVLATPGLPAPTAVSARSDPS